MDQKAEMHEFYNLIHFPSPSLSSHYFVERIVLHDDINVLGNKIVHKKILVYIKYYLHTTCCIVCPEILKHHDVFSAII